MTFEESMTAKLKNRFEGKTPLKLADTPENLDAKTRRKLYLEYIKETRKSNKTPQTYVTSNKKWSERL
jgi:hypothetical protein